MPTTIVHDPIPAWGLMWGIAFGIYGILKVLVWRLGTPRLTGARSAAFLLAWPGMNARPFAEPARRSVPNDTAQECLLRDVGAGMVAMVFGTVCWMLAAESSIQSVWSRLGLSISGLLLILHFGLFRALYGLWRWKGVSVAPIMNAPWISSTLSDFWGHRWNLAFRDAGHQLLFLPVSRKYGTSAALWAVFLISGLVHELVISIPAQAGYGGPTAYFLLQGLGIHLQKRWVKPHAQPLARLSTVTFLLLPLPLLFHRALATNVLIPFVEGVMESLMLLRPLPVWLFQFAGLLHFGVLIASAMVPRVLDWKGVLADLPKLVRELFWVHGAFIVLTIVGLGILSLLCAEELAGGSRLARSFCTFVSLFWGTRLSLQFLLFEPTEYLSNPFLKGGYHALTLVFALLTAVYLVGAVR